MIVFIKKIPAYAKGALQALLEAEPARKYHSWIVLWFVALFVIGVIAFGSFFQWGNHTLEYQDWADITGPRFQFLRTAVRTGQFPLHISDPSTLHGFTYRYLAVADAFISPQLVLLYWLSIQRFNLANVLILYTLGFAGLLALRSKLRLSAVSFAAVFLLFNFNGHILAHYSVGHATWGGYFLIPWFVWLVFRLLDGDRSWAWTLGMATLLFIIWLQGSFHQYVWLLMLLGCIAIFIPRTFWSVARAGVFTILISAFRILPSILLYGKYSADFINGYPSPLALLDSLVNLPGPINNPFFINGLGNVPGSWELTAYIGVVGGAFFLYFGIYRGLLHRRGPYNALLLPLGVILLLSFGRIFQFFTALPIPLIQGERVSARMFSLVLVFGLILAAERFQRWLDDAPQKPLSVAGSLLGLGIIAFELGQDLDIWRISNGSQLFWKYFNPHAWTVQNRMDDTIYLWLVFGGLALSTLTFLVLAGLAWSERRRAKQKRLEPQPAHSL
jgi:hypothetical protein